MMVEMRGRADATPSPRVSVCIRVVDRASELRRSGGSGLMQSFTDLEVIVADNAGGLGDVVSEFDDVRVRYCPTPAARGATANLMCALEAARGSLVAVLDDDDVWLPGFLEATVAPFDADSAVGVVYTDHYLVLADRRIRRRLSALTGPTADVVVGILDHSIPPSAALIRRH